MDSTVSLDTTTDYRDTTFNSSFLSVFDAQSTNIPTEEKGKNNRYRLPSHISPLLPSRSVLLDTNDYTSIDQWYHLPSYYFPHSISTNNNRLYNQQKSSNTKVDGILWRCLSPRAEIELKCKRGIMKRNGFIPHVQILSRL